MKKLRDGTIVLSRTYYYLLEFKDAKIELFIEKFGDKSIVNLSRTEFYEFFKLATNHDLKLLEHEQENF